MVRLTRIYTRTGDDGTTGLVTGPRVPKHGLRVAALGDVDEANSLIGMLRLETRADAQTDAMLGRIQNDLFDLGADLATPDPAMEGALRIVPGQVARLEAEIDAMNAELAPLTSFILPGGAPAAAWAFLARAVVRRAERTVAALAGEGWVSVPARQYLNRLSDHLFVLGRRLNAGHGEVLWTPGANR